MSKDIENLSEALDNLYSEESTESEVKADVEPEVKEDEVKEEIKDKEIKEEEPESEAQDEDEKEIPEVEEDLELDRKLSGQPKEFKDLVKSVKDPEVQARILEAGKVVRAREDKVRLELGNNKKELANVSGLLKFLDTDPAAAIKHIAQVTKVDLSTLVKPVVEDENDYRTPEEKARDQDNKDIKQKLSRLENERFEEQQVTINEEIKDFADSKDDKGNLKYPHFERVYDSMFDILGIDKQRLGAPKTSAERRERLSRAYQKAILFDDELVSIRDSNILKREQEKRAAQVEKIKSQKKFGGRSLNVNTAPSLTPFESNKQALSQLFG